MWQSFFLDLDSTQTITDMTLKFGRGWNVAIPLVAVSVAFAVFLYRSEERTTPTRRRVMACLQCGALLTLVLIFLQPTARIEFSKPLKKTMLILVDTSRSMSLQDQRSSPQDLARAARVLGLLPVSDTLREADISKVRQKIAEVSRFDLAQAALSESNIRWLEPLRESYDVRLFGFDRNVRWQLSSTDLAGDEFQASGDSTELGEVLDEASARYAGRPMAGMIVLSDFAWVAGRDPVEVAQQLRRRAIPVHTVPIGLPAPPDIEVQRIVAPEVAFSGDQVPIRVQVKSSGYAGDTVELTLHVDDQPVASKPIELSGDIQFDEFLYLPEKQSGKVALDVKVTNRVGEATHVNNVVSQAMRILDDKIKVLYVEGMPRWEYRYLRGVLLRDPRLDVQFLMTKGDPNLADASPNYIAQFPQSAQEILAYDLIILGDVPAAYFSDQQLGWIDELVRARGGSLLMVAGPMAAPSTYLDTPVADLLPVRLGNGQWFSVGADVHPVVTEKGRDSSSTSLVLSGDANDRIWSQVRPIHSLPELNGAKPGATVLLSLSKSMLPVQDYPLVAWHRYGNGKSLFVATEDLWRMRLEVGDRYHARFWGQTIQFLALSRLLGQNKQVTLESERTSYHVGEQIRVFANVLTESFEPVRAPSYPVTIARNGDLDSEVVLSLVPVPRSPGLYSGVYLAEGDGTYLLRAQGPDAQVANQVEIDVKTVALEARLTAMQTDVATQIAEVSGGKRLEIDQLGRAVSLLSKDDEVRSVARRDITLWDKPFCYILFALLAGTEWYLRRRDNLV